MSVLSSVINCCPSSPFVWKRLSFDTQKFHSFLARRPQHRLRFPRYTLPIHFDKKYLAVLSGKHIRSLKSLGPFRKDDFHVWDLVTGPIMRTRRACRQIRSVTTKRLIQQLQSLHTAHNENCELIMMLNLHFKSS